VAALYSTALTQVIAAGTIQPLRDWAAVSVNDGTGGEVSAVTAKATISCRCRCLVGRVRLANDRFSGLEFAAELCWPASAKHSIRSMTPEF
jgi:hypothetical protein